MNMTFGREFSAVAEAAKDVTATKRTASINFIVMLNAIGGLIGLKFCVNRFLVGAGPELAPQSERTFHSAWQIQSAIEI